MPRNNQGLYTLPSGNPVTAGTTIESAWANTTMADVAAALTGSMPRDGSAPMTGELILQSGNPINNRAAANKAYVDSFLLYATGLPVGSIVSFAGASAPNGFLLCNGQAVSRTTYASLFATIGTIYGPGDSSTTFNLPDLRSQFIRGRADGRAVGSTQSGSIQSHIHPVNDPGHLHVISNPTHTHSISNPAHTHSITVGTHTHTVTNPSHTHTGSQSAHSHTVSVNNHTHTVTDPGHSHVFSAYGGSGGSILPSVRGDGGGTFNFNTNASSTGISIASATGLAGSTNSATPAVSITAATQNTSIATAGVSASASSDVQNSSIGAAAQSSSSVNAVTGISIGSAGGTETVPMNIAMDYYIKALADSVGPTAITGVTSSDENMIEIDNTNPVSPELSIKANMPFGIPKLDQDGKVAIANLPTGIQTLLGLFDASQNANPSEKYPQQEFANGDTYIISNAGTINVYDPATNISAPTAVDVGWQLLYILDSTINPDGWYWSEPKVTDVIAAEVAFLPSGSVASTNVQDAIEELDGNILTHIGKTGTQVHGLGTASTLTATVDTTDETVGRAMKVGDFGYGTALTSTQTNLNSYPKNGIFLTPSTGLTNTPSDYVAGRHFLVAESFGAGPSYSKQILVCLSGGASTENKVWSRTFNGTTWTAWYRLQTSNDVTSSTTDATTGKLLKVGDFGLGATSPPTVLNANTAIVSGIYAAGGAGSTNYPAGQSVYGSLLVFTRAGNIINQICINATPAASTDFWVRGSANNGSTWSAWNKVLSSYDTTASVIDTTTGKLLKVGDFGLAGPSISAATGSCNNLVNGFWYPNGTSITEKPNATGAEINATLLSCVTNSQSYGFQLAGRGNAADLQWRGVEAAGAWTPWAKLFSQRNILGAVSQTGGIPTGAIVEEGSNANGRYTKLADGTLICYQNWSNQTCSTALGAFYTGPTITWTYPAVFSLAPSVATQSFNNGFTVGFDSPSTTSCSFKAAHPSSGGTATVPRAMAVGRWF